ncbi:MULTISPECIES: tetratricopeptide repeat protein [unclassified Helicobacter]|uniref:tetratricopeptide repeat protein n=1 Tax=unclassified Helicobacter TaxID=2593540 RepID=UPI0013152732|nr:MULTISPECIES: tetratricopeptide repeat protein [unclassified Helicobacter]
MRQISRLFGIILLLCAGGTSLVSEPSAFELQSGATKKELKNLQSTNKNLENLAIDYSARIQALEQAQDGLRSVLDGQSLRIKNLLDLTSQQETKIQALKADLEFQNETIKQQNASMEEMRQKIAQNTALIEQLNSKVSDLSALVARLNNDILSEISNLSKDAESSSAPSSSTSASTKANAGKSSATASSAASSDVKQTAKQTTTPKQTSGSKQTSEPKQTGTNDKNTKTPTTNKAFKNLSNKDNIDEARKLFRQSKYAESKERYEWLVQQNYKTPLCYYMLGEIAYQTGKFGDAIGYYKKSASLDESANYMPILLWHTAWAFRYSKDMTNYNKFLDSLIRLYPDSDQGKKAKDLRNKTK